MLRFAGARSLAPNADSAWIVNGLQFDAASTANVATAAFTLGGSAITINTSSGIANLGYSLATDGITHAISVGTATINNALTLGAAQTWSTSVVNGTLAGNLAVNGAVNNGGFLLTTSAAKGTNISLGGTISGSGGLTTTGLGTTTLSGTNSYSGATTVQGGTLSINTIANAGSNSAIGTNSSIVLGSSTNTGTLQYTGSGSTTNRTISLGGSTGGGTLDASGSGALTLTGTISGSASGSKTLTLSGNSTAANNLSTTAVISNGSGTLALAKAGSGTWTINAANTYTGGTTMNAGDSGILTVSSTGSIGSGNLTVNGGTINLNSSQSVGMLSGSGGTINLGSGTTLTTSPTGTGEFFGVLNGSGSLTKNGTGTLALQGAGSGYSGTTTLNTGTLALNSATAIGTGTLVINGGTLDTTSGAPVRLSTNNAITWNTTGFTFAGTGNSVAAGSGNLDLGTGAVTIINNSPTITVSANTLTVGGNIAGSFGITKAGAGGLTLGGTNSFTGGLTLNAGTLNLNSGTALGASAGTFTIGGGTLDNTSGAAVTIANNNAQNWNSNFTFTGTNDLNLGTGAVTMNATRQVTVTAGTLTVGGAISGSGAGLTKLGNGNLTLNGNLSNTGGVSASAGTLTLAGTNTYTGGTTLAAGATLNLNSTKALGATASTLTINGGTLDNTSGAAITNANNNAQSWNGDFTYAGTNALNLGTGAVTLGATRQVTVNDSTLTVGGVISGSTLGITKAGNGTLTLSGANTYTGVTTVNAGTLSVATIGNGGVAGNLGQATATASNLVLGGGTLQYTGSTASSNRSFTLTGGTTSTIDVSNSATTLTVSGAAAATSGALTKTGAGTLLLTGTNAYTGTTTVNAGTLQIGSNSAGSLNSSSGLTFTGTGTFAYSPSGGTVMSLGALTLSAGDATIQTTRNSGNMGLTFSSLATRATGATGLFSFASGTVGTNNKDVLTGQATGFINQGMFINTGAATNASFAYYDSTGFVRAPVYGTDANWVSVGAGTTVGANSNKFLRITGAISAQTSIALNTLEINGSRNLTLASGATLTLTNGGLLKEGNNAATISGGTALTPGSNAELVIRSDRASDALTINTPITANGTNALTKSGLGTLTLGGANTYTGATYVNGGTLTVNSGSNLSTAALTLSGGTLNLNNSAQTIGSLSGVTGTTLNLGTGHTLTVNDTGTNAFDGTLTGAGNLTKSGSGTLSLSGTNSSYTGATALNGGTLALENSAAIGSTGTISFGGGTLRFSDSNATDYSSRFSTGSNQAYSFDTNGQSVTLATALTSSGGSLTKSGAGTLTLNGANTYTGDTTLAAGTLMVNSGSAIGSGTGNLVINGGELVLNNASQSVASLSGTGGELSLGAGHAFTDTDTGTHTFSGAINGPSSSTFTLNGSGGTLTLNGTSSNFYGDINVTAGKLLAGATNALGRGDVTIGTGTALGLAGGSTQNLASLTLTGTGVSNGGALFNNDTNTNVINSSLTLGGATQITSATSGGTLQIGASTLAGWFGPVGHAQPDEIGTITLGANNNLTFTGAGNITVYDRIQDFAGQSAVNTAAYGSAGSVTINMTGGTVTYAANANTYTGTTNVTSGTLVLDNGNINNGTAPHDPVTDSFHLINGALSIGNGGTATVKLASDDVMASTTDVTLYSTGTLNLNGHIQTIDNLTFNHGGTVTIGGGDLYLNNDVAFTASAGETASIGNGVTDFLSFRLFKNTTADAGVLDAVRTFTVTGDQTSNLTINAFLQNGSLVKAGTGMLTLAGSGDYTGATFVNAGILNVRTSTSSGQSSLGASDGTDAQGTHVANGATLQLQGGVAITSERLNINGDGYGAGKGALESVSGTNTWGAAGTTLLNLMGDARIQADAGTLNIPTNIASYDNARNLTIGAFGNNTTSSTVSITGNINTGSGTLTKDGYGTLILAPTGSSGYTGLTTVSQGILSAQTAGALGTTAAGTTVSSGAQLQLSGGISILGEAITLNGTGYSNGTYNDSTGALRNVSGNNSLSGAITLADNTKIMANSGTTLTLSGGVDTVTPSHKDLTIIGNVTETGAITSGNVSTSTFQDGNGLNVTKVTGSGSGGTLTIGGTTNIANTIANASGNLTLGGGVTSTLDGITLTLGNLTVGNGTGNTLVQAGPISSSNANNVLTIGPTNLGSGDKVNGFYSGSTTFTGKLDGYGTFEKDGAGTLTFNTTFSAPNLTLVVTDGTLALANGINITVGTLHLAGTSGTQIHLDFGNNSSVSTVLSAANVKIDPGVAITIDNWTSEVDFWYATSQFYQTGNPTNVSAVPNAQGVNPQNQITFNGFNAANTAWLSWAGGPYTDKEIRPIPEPATYGAIFFSGCLALLGWCRLRRRD